MHIVARTLAIGLLFSVSHVHAANCRSGDAAARGGEIAFQRDKKAADAMAKSEADKSATLAKCLGGITGVVTTPQFPSLSDIYDKLKKKVCQLARDQVNGVVRSTNNRINDEINDAVNKPIGDAVNNAEQGVDKTVRDATGGKVDPNIGDVTDLPRISGPTVQQTTDGTEFWRKIWQ